MSTMSDSSTPQGRQDRTPVPAGQDEVESGDRDDNLGDADTPADLGGLLGTEATSGGPASEDREGFAGLGPDTARTGGGATGDRATGVTDLRG